MNKIDKRLADLYRLLCQFKEDEKTTYEYEKKFGAILCQIDMLGRDLEGFHLIEKCKGCHCDD